MSLPVNEIVCGDCLDVMRGLPDACIDAVVTDPPYGISFMSKKWDYDVPSVDIWREVMRVLKPGGRLLAFSGARTYHRMAVNIEDAGFCIEDQIMWLYGSGFPKHGSKLKPAHEPIVVARKGPVSLLNIDAARIEYLGEADKASAKPQGRATSSAKHAGAEPDAGRSIERTEFEVGEQKGRWPANVVLDEEAAALLDEQSGVSVSSPAPRKRGGAFAGGGFAVGTPEAPMHGDSGGASRFFYCAKASRSERNAGCEGLPEKVKDAEYREPTGNPMVDRIHGCGKQATNHHPTVKPVKLMRWLIRLVTQPGELVLDPFGGSGTTGIAAQQEGRDWILIERDPDYVEIARARTAKKQARTEPTLFEVLAHD